MKYKTLKEWNEAGFYVRKGEHSFKKNLKNIPLFSEKQVEVSKQYSVDYNEDDYYITDYEIVAGEHGD